MKLIKVMVGVCLALHGLYANSINQTPKRIEDSYCKPIHNDNKDNKEFCMEYSIEYPHITHPNQALANRINQAINKHLKPTNAKAYVEEYIKEIGEDIWLSSHNEETTIKLFSLTPATFTLSVATSSFSGGAHGSYNYQAYNYDRKSGKAINLDDLFAFEYRDTLHDLAQKAYRQSVNISSNANLTTTQDWFENRFVLAKSIAFGEEALHFFYNPYEIKPYSAGTTEFKLRYQDMQELISPDSTWYALFKQGINQTNGNVNKVFSSNEGSLKITLIPQENRKVHIIATVQGFSHYKAGGFSLSFPQLGNKNLLKNIASNQLVKMKLYPTGSRLFYLPTRKSVTSNYLLLEADTSEWSMLEFNKRFSCSVTVPKYLSHLVIHARLAFRQKGQIIKIPNDGIEGQQGFKNYEVSIPIAH